MVPAYVQPRDCFVQYASNALGYQPIGGTPCAHYVSHALGIQSTAGGFGCSKGYELRVRALITHLTQITLDQVQVNDVWARVKGEPRVESSEKEPTDHCGLVVSVDRTGAKVEIQIRHDSSSQQTVATNSWDKFGRGGKFYRPANASALPASAQSSLYRVQKGLPLRST
jgi:hypothetical protein